MLSDPPIEIDIDRKVGNDGGHWNVYVYDVSVLLR